MSCLPAVPSFWSRGIFNHSRVISAFDKSERLFALIRSLVGSFVALLTDESEN